MSFSLAGVQTVILNQTVFSQMLVIYDANANHFTASLYLLDWEQTLDKKSETLLKQWNTIVYEEVDLMLTTKLAASLVGLPPIP